MNYSAKKTAGKAVPPLILIIVIRAAIAAVESAGIKIDENIFWTVATGGYAALVSFVNWLKNHKKKDI
jgi:hypothetical protein